MRTKRTQTGKACDNRFKGQLAGGAAPDESAPDESAPEGKESQMRNRGDGIFKVSGDDGFSTCVQKPD